MKTLLTLAITSMLLSSCTSTVTGAKPYPLKTCLVTGNELGAMGDPVSLVHNGQEIKFCCKPCVKKFQANPEKYLAKLK